MNENGIYNVGLDEIYKILPHRYPFLFVDYIINLEHGKRATGLRAVTSDEDFLLFSPSLIVEAMAQVAGIALSYDTIFLPPPLISGEIKRGDYIGYLAEVRSLSFLEDICIGDRLFLDVELTQKFGNLFRFTGTAHAGDRIIAKGELSIAIVLSSG